MTQTQSTTVNRDALFGTVPTNGACWSRYGCVVLSDRLVALNNLDEVVRVDNQSKQRTTSEEHGTVSEQFVT